MSIYTVYDHAELTLYFYAFSIELDAYIWYTF